MDKVKKVEVDRFSKKKNIRSTAFIIFNRNEIFSIPANLTYNLNVNGLEMSGVNSRDFIKYFS